jgi:hypothetical protein
MTRRYCISAPLARIELRRVLLPTRFSVPAVRLAADVKALALRTTN